MPWMKGHTKPIQNAAKVGRIKRGAYFLMGRYIDKDGNETIPAKYDYVSLFYESEGLVAQRNELFFIDAQGNFIRKLLKNDFFKTI